MTVFNEWKSKKIQGEKNNFGFVIFLFFFALFSKKIDYSSKQKYHSIKTSRFGTYGCLLSVYLADILEYHIYPEFHFFLIPASSPPFNISPN